MTSLLGTDPFSNLSDHHAVLLSGQKGIGKSGFAKVHICKEWLKSNQGDESETFERLAQENLEGVWTVIEQNGLISVNQVVNLREKLGLSSLVPKRFVLIDSVDSMTIQAQNALLKVLEEPPLDLKFVLIHHGTAPLLPTIRSRCLLVSMTSLSNDQIKSILKTHKMKADDKLIQYAGGSAEKAITFAKHWEEVDKILTLLDQCPNFSWEEVRDLPEEIIKKDYFWKILRMKVAEWATELKNLNLLTSLLLLRVKRDLEEKPLLWLFLSLVEKGYKR